MIKIFITDDHQSYKEGLAAYLKADKDITIVGQASNGEEAVQALQKLPVDILILDIDMPLMNGEDTLKKIKKLRPEIRVLILTSLNDQSLVDSLKQSGAEGFRNKEACMQDIIQAIHRLHQGYTDYLIKNENTLNRLTIRYNSEDLTSQEKHVVKHLAQGLTVKAIAETMHLSPHTIDSHCKTARAKTGAKNVAELVAIAIKKGLI
ncbi:MAG: response regulator [Bacteroidales bacterium]